MKKKLAAEIDSAVKAFHSWEKKKNEFFIEETETVWIAAYLTGLRAGRREAARDQKRDLLKRLK